MNDRKRFYQQKLIRLSVNKGDFNPTLFTKEKAVDIADHCNKGDDEWEYLVAPSTTVDKYCVAVLDESGQHVGFF